MNDTSNLIQGAAKISAAMLVYWDHDANQLYCRDMSQGLRKCLLKGDFIWGEDYRALSKPRSEGGSGQLGADKQRTD